MSPNSGVVADPSVAQMNVRKRNGALEPINLEKIVRAVTRCAAGISDVDPHRVAVKTIGSVRNGVTTRELDQCSINTAASLIGENSAYSKLAAALLLEFIRKEVEEQGIHSFSQSVERSAALGLVQSGFAKVVEGNARKLNNVVNPANDELFEYFGLRNFYENLLLRDSETGLVIETPQYFFMRAAITQVFAQYTQVNQTSPNVRQFVSQYRSIAANPAIDPKSLVSKPTRHTDAEAVPDDDIEFKPLAEGMGQAVAERTILRKKADGSWEDWGDVAKRVALGNTLLHSTPQHPFQSEYRALHYHIAKAHTLMSGRHLQHGDSTEPTRTQEVFTNCATSAASFLTFYLLLNGSGVGRAYDDDLMLANWDFAPNIRCVLDSNHPDFNWDTHESLRDARHKYGAPDNMVWFPAATPKEQWKDTYAKWEADVAASGGKIGAPAFVGKNVIWFQVPDSREGWAKALEFWEVMAFEKIHANTILILDFSPVRPKNTPIGGMQGRPASGPIALMNAFLKASAMKGAGLAPWKQAMYVDHYFAECVLVGGARRAARMSTKQWTDPTVLDFITVKRPVEYLNMTVEEIIAYRKRTPFPPMGFLWSSNNSVTVDAQFWDYVMSDTPARDQLPLERHAKAVFDKICEASYADGTGEPGLINRDKLVQNDEGWADLNRGDYVDSAKYKVNEDTQILLSRLAKRVKKKKYHTITNPCGEIALNMLGGFCVIADVVPFHCDTLDEAEDAFRVVTRALMRVNLMDSIYSKEVKRTNRIGVGITGIHEFAWKFFGLGFRDLIDEERSRDFWLTMARFNRAVADEAERYAKELGVEVPHTRTTIKPAGTTSKLFRLTEGWHLPSMVYYLRWVQFRSDDPLVVEYKNNGYPTRELTQYSGTTIVGFPTAPMIATLGMGDKVVTAGEATPEEQYKWLMLGEKYWINGTDENGEPVTEDYGNQISYTLKYQPNLVSFEHFKEMLLKYQSKVRCCSVMPQEDTSSYEYLPEQRITKEEFDQITAQLEQSVYRKAQVKEEIGREHVDCSSGACPIDFKTGNKG